MNKKLLIFAILCSYIPLVNADYYKDSISSFVNSISQNEISSIENLKLRFCEETFLKAYMRRDFTKDENTICRDIFTQKIEAEMNYMRYVFDERGLY